MFQAGQIGRIAVARRAALFLGMAISGGALAFLLGLLGGQPDGAAVWAWLSGSFAAVATIMVMALRLVLGTPKNEAAEAVSAICGTLLGGLLFAGFAAAFVAGIYVCFEAGWGDRGIQGDLGGIDQTWQSWLRELLEISVQGGGIASGLLGFLAWASRFVRMGGNAR
jgi:hypothetical protein